jgi:hypothetical protein
VTTIDEARRGSGRLAFGDIVPGFLRAMMQLDRLIIVINAWNAAGVATRAWEPGTYQP